LPRRAFFEYPAEKEIVAVSCGVGKKEGLAAAQWSFKAANEGDAQDATVEALSCEAVTPAKVYGLELVQRYLPKRYQAEKVQVADS
jgi:hypothetical protein